MALTLGQIERAIRRRLGWPETDAFVSDAELDEMIRQSRRELLDLLTTIHQGDYRLAFGDMQTVAGQPFYLMGPFDPSPAYGTTPALLGDFVRIRKVALLVDNTLIPLKRWDVETSVDRVDEAVWDASTDVRYRISSGLTAGDAEKLIFFYPTPADVYQLRIWGNEGIDNLTFSETDTVNGLGNDEYLILDGMIKCLQMEESDSSLVERQKARYIEMLSNNQPPMDAGQPETIHDARGADFDVGYISRYR